MSWTERRKWLEYAAGTTLTSNAKDWEKAANAIADYDLKLAALIRDVAQAYRDLNHFAKEVERAGE
jgi:hypothetical protein